MRSATTIFRAVVLALAGLGSAWATQPLFKSDGRLYPTTSVTVDVNSVTLSADVNHDGAPYLLCLQVLHGYHFGSADYLSVWLGTPTGLSATPTVSLSASSLFGLGLNDMALADLDGDGWLDIVATSANGIELLKNQRDGHFFNMGRAGGESPTSNSIVAADLDQDGDPDLLLTDRGRKELIVYIGNGGFTFAPGPVIPISAEPHTLGVARLDTDGFPDVVVGCRDSSFVFHGGPGLAFTTTLFTEGRAFIAGDLDGDGRPDLITEVSVRPSSANFAVTLPQPVSSPVAAVDLNGDGAPDLVGMPPTLAGQVPRLLVARGLGAGAFGTVATYRRVDAPRQVPAFADFDHDGHVDLALAPSEYSNAYVLRGQPGGAFENGHVIATPVLVDQMATGRLNTDGVPDFVIYDVGTSSVRTMLSNGSGGYTFTPPVTTAAGGIGSLSCTDLDANGIDDVVCRYSTGPIQTISLWFTGPGGALGPRLDRTVTTDVTGIGELNARDFDGDGRGDLFVTAGISAGFTVSYRMRGLGNGNFTVSGRLRQLNTVSFADMNNDGFLDAVGAESVTGGLIRTYLPTSPGNFSMFSMLEQSSVYAMLGTGDLDLDGIPDVLGFGTASTMAFFRNLGDGTLDVPVVSPFPVTRGIGLRDLDQDGRLDACIVGTGVEFWHGLGGPNFRALERFPAAGAVNAGFAFADADGDGRPDAWRSVADGILLMKNQAGSELLEAPPTPKPGSALALELRPNPSHGRFDVSLAAPREGPVRIEIIGVDGRRWESRTVTAPAGRSKYEFTGTMPAGMYFVRVHQGGVARVGRTIVLR